MNTGFSIHREGNHDSIPTSNNKSQFTPVSTLFNCGTTHRTALEEDSKLIHNILKDAKLIRHLCNSGHFPWSLISAQCIGSSILSQFILYRAGAQE